MSSDASKMCWENLLAGKKKIMAKRTKGGVKSLIFELNAKNLEFKNFRISGTVKLLILLPDYSVVSIKRTGLLNHFEVFAPP